MDVSLARHQIECTNIPSEISSDFDSLFVGLETSHASYRNSLMRWHSSPDGLPPVESWKKSEPYLRLATNPEFLPFIRREYMLALKHADVRVSSYVWEKLIEDLTGGPIAFSE